MYVYVINKNGKPLMPCKPAKAKHLLREGKAKVIKTTPFTIKLLWDCEDNVQEIIAGMDTGSKKIGTACVSNNKVIYQSEITIRYDISRKMKQRAMFRRNRRGRKCRYRKQRFLNRSTSRTKERLSPSIKSKIFSHLKEKNFIEKILPISKWIVETVSFDIHKISNPDVVNYQDGDLKDFYNIKAYILHRDSYKCQKCKKKNLKLHIHHKVFRSKGGSNSPDNLITLCKQCHEDLHEGKFVLKGKKSKTQHATQMGIIKSQLKKAWIFKETFGYKTKYFRKQILNLKKTHYNDAVAICGIPNVKLNDAVYYKRHVCSGDYKQTRGKHSQIKIPTGKLFGYRKFDLVKTPKRIGFIKGKRSSGYFVLGDIFWKTIYTAVNIKKNSIRLSARKTTLLTMELIN